MFSRRKETMPSLSTKPLPPRHLALIDADEVFDEHADLIHSSPTSTSSFTSGAGVKLRTPLVLVVLAICLIAVLFLLGLFPLPSAFSPSTALTPSSSAPLLCCSTTRYHPRLQIVTVGDSITDYGGRPDGWVSLLSSHYLRKADVFNRGYGGYNTDDYLHLLHQHLAHGSFPFTPTLTPLASSTPHYQQLVTLYLGTNDAARDTSTSDLRQHVPLPQFRTNLRLLVARLVPEYAAFLTPLTSVSQYPSTRTALILITPTQMDAEAWAARNTGPPPTATASSAKGRTNEITLQYVEVVREVARDWSVPLLDLWDRTGQEANGEWGHLDKDGLHLNAKGNRVVYEGVLQVVGAEYPELDVRQLMADAPLYTDIDRRNASATFNTFATIDR